MTGKPTPLSSKMRAIACEHSHLSDLADKLDEAADGFDRNPPTVTVGALIGAWAKASKAYTAATGEDLV